MKCIECNKNFKPPRKDAKFCSGRCRTSHFRRLKREAIVFEKEQQLSLGEIQEKQKRKVSEIDKKIQWIEQKVKGLQLDFNSLKEQEKIILVELKSVREAIKESEQKIELFSDALVMDDDQFYELHCKDVEVKATDLGALLNGIINMSLIGFNIDERHKEMKRVREQLADEIIDFQDVLLEDTKLLQALFKRLKLTKGKLKKKHNEILDDLGKMKILERQKLIAAKEDLSPKIKRVPLARNNENGIGGADLQNMTFNTFMLDSELGRFLGELDKNKTAFALTGDSGAGKSYFSFELAKVFIDGGFSVKYFALEEGLGKLTQNKVRFYGLGNDITITGTGTLRDVRRDAKLFDLIVIDSFQKLNVKAEEFERLRQDFPKTIFIIIFQKTTSGTMRGGSSIKFNSSATIDVQLKDGERIAVMEKGRYGTIGWMYSIDEGRIVNE